MSLANERKKSSVLHVVLIQGRKPTDVDAARKALKKNAKKISWLLIVGYLF